MGILAYASVTGVGAVAELGGGLVKEFLGENGRVMMGKGALFLLWDPAVGLVDALPSPLALPEGADVKIIADDLGHRIAVPHRGSFGFQAGRVLALGLALLDLQLDPGGEAALGEMPGDFPVAPPFGVEPVDETDHFRPLFVNAEFPLAHRVQIVAIGRVTDPLPLGLPGLDDGPYFFAGVGHRHLVHEKAELDVQPVIPGGVVHAVADGDDAHPLVPQQLQLIEPQRVASGKTGEILHHQNGTDTVSQGFPQLLVSFPLLEGVARPVPVGEEGEGTAGKTAGDILLDHGFLVFDGGILLIQCLVHRDAAVSGNGGRLSGGHTRVSWVRRRAVTWGSRGSCPPA